MFERPASGERAVLVHVNFPSESDQEDLQEFIELVRSAGAEAVAVVTPLRRINNTGRQGDASRFRYSCC